MNNWIIGSVFSFVLAIIAFVVLIYIFNNIPVNVEMKGMILKDITGLYPRIISGGIFAILLTISGTLFKIGVKKSRSY